MRENYKLKEAEDFVIWANSAFDRTSLDSSQSDMITDVPGWRDVDNVNIPEFLGRTIVSQYATQNPERMDDIINSTLYKEFKHGLKESGRSLDDLQRSFREVRDNHSNILKNTTSDTESILKRSIAYASLKELSKAQILVGAPIYHHNLVVEDHQKYDDIPHGFSSRNWDWVGNAALWFRSFTSLERSRNFTLPIGTSQGMTLKSKSDTPQWRVYSKGLLSMLALRSETIAELYHKLDAVDGIFESKGYDGIAKHSFLGMRRQHTNKVEPSTVSSHYHTQGYDTLLTTQGIQGRVRAIFPFSEALKVFYKPFADGLKKSLFHKTSICNVNMNHISDRLHLIASLSLKNNLINNLSDGSHEWLPFYDLSEYDRTTHKGCYDIYITFLNKAFNNFSDIEGRPYEDCGIVFPCDLDEHTSFMINNNRQRSTLSGQSDVTVKNNIVHLLIASQAISEVLGNISPLEVFKKLIDPSSFKKEGDIIGIMHGDDAAIFFSSNREDYVKYTEIVSDMGIKTGFEMGPIYLKKVPYWTKGDSTLLNMTPALVDKLSKCNQIDDSYPKAVASSGQSGYNAEYLGYLQPVTGSLIRNRFGEYSVKMNELILASLSDTLLLLDDSEEALYLSYWQTLFNFVDISNLDERLQSLISKDVRSLKSVNFREQLMVVIRDKFESKTIKSATMRGYLDALFYKNAENISEEQLIEIYGNLMFDPSELTERIGIADMSNDELLDLILELQSYILDNEGECPTLTKEVIEKLKPYTKYI